MRKWFLIKLFLLLCVVFLQIYVKPVLAVSFNSNYNINQSTAKNNTENKFLINQNPEFTLNYPKSVINILKYFLIYFDSHNKNISATLLDYQGRHLKFEPQIQKKIGSIKITINPEYLPQPGEYQLNVDVKGVKSWQNKFSWGTESEIIEKRTISSKTYKLTDKSLRSVFSTGAKHFQDGNGKFQDIKTNLVKSTNQNFLYENTTNVYKSYFGQVNIGSLFIKLKESQNIVEYGLAANKHLGEFHSSSPEVINNQIIYKNIYSGIHLKYTVKPEKVLEEFILEKYRPVSRIDELMKVSGMDYKLNSDQTIDFTDKINGKKILTIPAPVLYEITPLSDGGIRKNVSNFGIRYELKNTDNGMIIISKVLTDEGKKWLSDPQRVFPVVVDAVDTYHISGSENDGKISGSGSGSSMLVAWNNARINLIDEGGTVNTTTPNVPIGTSCQGSGTFTCTATRAYFRWDTSVIPDNDVINSAKIRLFLYSDTINDFTIQVVGGNSTSPEFPCWGPTLTTSGVNNCNKSSLGLFDTAGLTVNSVFDMPISNSAINKTDYTALSLRHINDNSSLLVSGNIQVQMYDDTGTDEPDLIVDHSVADSTGPNMILFWDHPTLDAPDGWTCISCFSGQPFYQRFMRGNSSYGIIAGGNSSHSHSSVNISVSAPNLTAGSSASTRLSGTTGSHIHTLTVNSGLTGNNLPEYRNLKVIKYNNGIPATLPAGVIALFDSSPPSGWTSIYNDGRYFQGETTLNIGTTGGSNTHSHSLVFNSTNTVSASTIKTGSSALYSTSSNHYHTVANSASATANNEPPYQTAILAKKDSDGQFKSGFIAMFDTTLSTDWVSLSSQVSDPFYQKFIKPTGVYGNSASTSTHSHSVLNINTSAPVGNVGSSVNSGTVFSDSGHTHSVTVNFGSAIDHTPPYWDVIFGKYNPPTVDVNLSGTVFSDEGITNIGIGKTVYLRVNGAGTYSTTTNSSGVWSINNVSLALGSVVIVYLSGAETASTLFISDATSQSDINLYQNKLILHSDSGTVSNNSFVSGNCQDTNQLFSLSNNIVSVNSNIDLYILTGTTFDATSEVTVNSNLQVFGSLTGEQEINVLGGSVTGSGQINLSGGQFLIKGTGNFGGSTNWTFYDLNFGDGSIVGTTSKIDSNIIDIGGVLTVSQNHTLQAGSTNWTFNSSNVSPLKDIKSIDAGYDQTCAVKNDGTVYCWGTNSYGQLGDYSTNSRSTPVQVVGLGGTGVLSDISQVAMGYLHACALKNNGSAVYCWGLNTTGQCGNNVGGNTEFYPVQVVGLGGTGVLSDISQIDTGGSHTCALKNDGSAVYCWGDDSYGQLGDNYTGSTFREYPIQVKGVGGVGILSGILQITLGSNHSCSLKNDNTIYCWGNNNFGQIGIGTTAVQSSPIQVKGVDSVGILSSISQISSENYHTCALKNDGSEAYCWGYNSYGQIGNNQTGNNILTPTLVVGAFTINPNLVQINTGTYHTCALNIDNSVFCWGRNNIGQLGTNNTNTYITPTQVVGPEGMGNLTGITYISLGNNHSCAMKNNGTAMYCWGSNINGTLGNNITNDRYNPGYVVDKINIKPISFVKSVSVGGGHACTVKNDNSAVYCWGSGNYGQLGNQSLGSFQYNPIQVLGLGSTGFLSSISQVFIGYRNTCALDSNDSNLYCWGNNNYGQVGIGATTTQGLSAPNPIDTGILSNVFQAAIGGYHVCALKTNDSVYCWGYGRYGQLGIGNTADQSLPNQIKGVGGTGTAPSVSQISAGYYHTCALKNDNLAVYCWGQNDYGQLGIGNTVNQSGLIQVKGVGGGGFLSNISQIANGYNFAFAVKSDNLAVYGWGQNNRGQLGIGNTANQYLPTEVVGAGGTGVLSDITQISAGYYHACVLKTEGSVYCWGRNVNGQLGINNFTDQYFPTQVVGAGGTDVLSDISQISVGSYTTCAYQSSTNRILCWGSGASGTLGNNSSVDSPYPVYVSTDSFKSFDLKGSLIPQSSTFEYSSPLDKTKYVVAQMLEPASYNNVTIESPSYLSTLNGNIILSNNLNISSGVLDADLKSLNIGGNFTNSGDFYANKGLVSINSSNISILDYNSDTTFYDLSITGVGKTVQFDQTYQTKVTNSLTFQGDSCSNKLSLNSITDTDQWDLNYTGVGGSATINYVDLHDANTVNPLTANNSSQISDNNTNWTINAGICTSNQSPNIPQIPYVNNNSAQTGQTSPVTNLTDHTPAFSAIFDDPDTADTAIYYQLQVGNDNDWSDTPELWDSSKLSMVSCVENARCIDIIYEGSPLLDGVNYYWRLKFWDNRGGEGAWSDTQQFSLNYSPEITNIVVNSGININLNEGTTAPVSMTAIVTDASGFMNIVSTKGRLYRSGVTGADNCVLNNNNCYEVNNCSLTDCAGNSCTVNCDFNLQFHTEPTDSTSIYPTEYWRGWVEAIDGVGDTGVAYSSPGSPDIISFSGFDITPSVSYGEILPGDDTNNREITTTITNTGNRTIDVELSGNDLCTDYPLCNGFIIAVTNQQFSSNAFVYGSGNPLTTSWTTVNLNLSKPITAPSGSIKPLFWGIGIPFTKETGNYSSYININSIP